MLTSPVEQEPRDGATVTDMVPTGWGEERRLVAGACRVLAGRGLAWTTAQDIRLVTLDGVPGGHR